MTTAAPTFLAVQIPDLVIVGGVLALILLLLATLVEQPVRDGDKGSCELLEQPDYDCGRRHTWRFGDSRPASRNLWLVQPGAAIVDNVPAEVRAEALEILDTLSALDALFPDHRHPTRNNDNT